MIWPTFQPGPISMPTSPLQKAVKSCASSLSAGAPLASVMIRCTISRPSIDSSEPRTPAHSSPSWTAMSPPASQMKVRAACQLRPGK